MYVYIRESDKKEFFVNYLAHWTEISSKDGEKDLVKLYGRSEAGELFIGDHKYVRIRRDGIQEM